MSNIDSNEVWLYDQCKGKDWLYDIGTDQYGRYVVYANYINGDVLRFVPDRTPDGKQVLCHFAASVKASADQFIDKPNQSTLLVRQPIVPEPMDEEAQDIKLEQSVQELTDELDRLEKLCGTNTLQDIFFEEHDQKNAITNYSASLPEVKAAVHKLYERYGFDLLYEMMNELPDPDIY